jgi:hypothetical protein
MRNGRSEPTRKGLRAELQLLQTFMFHYNVLRVTVCRPDRHQLQQLLQLEYSPIRHAVAYSAVIASMSVTVSRCGLHAVCISM